MSFPSVVGFLKGLLIQDPNDRTKQFSVEVSPSATTGTRTTLIASQTANRTITLPDSSGAVLTTTTPLNATQIADGSVTNTEFQYINSLSSNAQDQLDANAAAIAAHIADATDAHTASAITNVPSGNLTATDVQSALNEIQTELDGFSGGGANLFLSNLSSPTAINQHLIAGTTDTIDVGVSNVNRMRNVYSQQLYNGNEIQAGTDHGQPLLLGTAGNGETPLYSPSGVFAPYVTAATRPVAIFTRDNSVNDASVTGALYLETGNKTVGSANSGDIQIRTGTATATRGKILLQDGTQGTAGHVWTSTDTAGRGGWVAPAAIVTQGTYGSVGANGFTNGLSANATFVLNGADSVTLRNSSNEVIVRYNVGAISNVSTVAGPTANGRDQVGAFTASSWVYIYWIWNGSTLATVSSASPPPTGPTLPSGYTHWCYATAIYFTAGSLFEAVLLRGSTVSYISTSNFLVSGAALSPASTSLTALIPPHAISYDVQYTGIVASTAGGLADARVTVYTTGSSSYILLDRSLTGLGATQATTLHSGTMVVPNFLGAQAFRYSWSVASGTSPGLTLRMLGYKVPNNGE